MPLRDHFRPPLDDVTSWESFHGQWPAMIVMALERKLPRRYVAGSRVRLGVYFETDVGASEEDEPAPFAPGQDEYEVRVYDSKRHRRLVATVEIVNPANKDRPENHRAFIGKCAALLQERVSVTIVDLVTTRQFNLYGDLLEFIGQADPSLAPEPPPLYVAACRWTRQGDAPHFEAWAHELALGEPLPTLPLWLADNLAVPLELEATYEETCRVLRIP